MLLLASRMTLSADLRSRVATVVRARQKALRLAAEMSAQLLTAASAAAIVGAIGGRGVLLLGFIALIPGLGWNFMWSGKKPETSETGHN